ncbi:MAG TPA: hypothetical protein VIM37_02535 [Candidatus Microsaccharimonas sp.]|jgi:hypothetical protein
MIQKLKHIIAAGLLVLGVGMILVPSNSYAVNPIADQCKTDPSAIICKDQGASPAKLIATIVNVLLFIIGAIAVIMIIIGGIMYATSAGDAGQVTKAKNTILYAVVGLVVAFLAYAIVNFVVLRFT